MLRNGDLIKAFEFEPIPGREDKYVIGAIDRIEEYGYVIKGETIIKDTVYGTARMNENVTVRVPFKTRFDYPGRIVAMTEDFRFTEAYYDEFPEQNQ
jgi:hypothetical protein